MIAILIQTRLGSTRLPEKALLPLGDSTVLGQVIRRCKKTGLKVIVVTPDKKISDIAKEEGVDLVSRLYLNKRDVLAEYYNAAMTNGVDTIIRITGDCPCVSPKEINQMVGMFENRDIICNHSDGLTGLGVDGLDIEVFSFNALKKAYNEAVEPSDREHVCLWMYSNLRSEQIACSWEYYPKLSIDTQEDYELVCDIYNELGNDFETIDIMNYFKDKEK